MNYQHLAELAVLTGGVTSMEMRVEPHMHGGATVFIEVVLTAVEMRSVQQELEGCA